MEGGNVRVELDPAAAKFSPGRLANMGRCCRAAKSGADVRKDGGAGGGRTPP